MLPFKGIFKSVSTKGNLLVFAGITAFSFFVTSLVTLLLTGGDINETGNLRLAQLIQSFGIFIFPPLMYAYLKDGDIANGLKFSKKPDYWLLIAGMLVVFVSIPAVNRLISINELITFPDSLKDIETSLLKQEHRLKEITERMLVAGSVYQLIGNLMLMALLPAVGEELFFRGVLQKILGEKLNMHVAVLLTALIFSVFHMQFYGLIPRFFLGAVLGYLFLYSGNLWVPVVAHFTNNALAILFHYLQENKLSTFNPEIPGREGSVVLVLFSLILVFGIIFLIASRQQSSKPAP